MSDTAAPLGIPSINGAGVITPIIPPPGWTAAPLVAPWFNSAARGGFLSTNELAGYYLDAFGIVHIRGLITTDVNVGLDGESVHAFTLPPGYRPPGLMVDASAQYVLTNSWAYPGHILVLVGGEVMVQPFGGNGPDGPGVFGSGNLVSLRTSFETW